MGVTRFFRRRYWDDERARELQAYLEHEIDDNVARGMSPEYARRAAHRKLGNAARIREDIYDMNTLGFLETAWQDLRYGARLLRRNPIFATVAIITLALGTGANAAIFQLVDAVRLRTLPVERPDRLVEVRIDARGRGRTGSFISRRSMLTDPLWDRLKSEQPFASTAAWSSATFDLAGGGEVRPAQGMWVSGTFFETLGVPAAIGRVFNAADDVRGCPQPGAVLSHAFWQREYGGDPGVLGKTILLDGHRLDIVGVTPPRFFGIEVGRSYDVAVPLCSEPMFRPGRTPAQAQTTWYLAMIARLKDDWTEERATAHLRALSPALFKETLPASYVPRDAEGYLAFLLEATQAGTGFSSLRGAYSTPLWILLGVTGLVLLIACANLANLMLARASAREREIGVRIAIGASRRRIARQMLSESVLLAALGAAAGLVLARSLSGVLVAFLTTDRNRVFLDLAFDWRIFAFTAAIAATSCILFGLAPAIRASAAVPAQSILGGRGTTDGRERFTLRRALVVVQVALSLVLVVGALLFGRTLQNLLTLDPGFREEGLMIVSLDTRRAAVPAENRRTLYNEIVARLQAVPGVDAAAEGFITPVSGAGWNNRVVIDGQVQQTISNFNAVGPGYFKTMGTRLVAGREFTTHDTPQSVRVAIVNETFARTMFPGGGALGRIFSIEEGGDRASPRYQVVGIVADTKYTGLRESLTPIAYLAAMQDTDQGPFLNVMMHSTTGEAALVPAVTHAVREVNPVIAVQFQTMSRLLSNSLVGDRLMAALSAFFGALATLIATTGLYGVMSYIVARRRMEIGIRMALGADRATVIRMVVGEAGVLLAIGIAVGTLLAVAGARAAHSLLFGLQPWDPAMLTLGISVLGGVSLIASWLPAYRASRLPPTVALREQA